MQLRNAQAREGKSKMSVWYSSIYFIVDFFAVGKISKVDQFLYLWTGLDRAGLGDHEFLPVTSHRTMEQNNMRTVSRASYILRHSAIEPLFYEAHKIVCANRRLSFSMRLLLVSSSQDMSI